MRIFISFLSLLVCSISLAQNNDHLWLRNTAISPDGKIIAFTYNADIYSVSSKGGKATRLTTNSAYDTKPVWSHDGKHIAFASNRHGNFDVFVMPSNGGTVKRLTFHSADDYPSDFSSNNTSVLFNSVRLDNHKSLLFHRLGELYAVSLDASTPKQIESIPAYETKTNENGELLFEEIKGGEDQWRKKHTSSVTRDIWKKYKNGTYKKVTDFNGEDRNPVFGIGGTFYYLSERNGTFNVFKSSLANSDDVTQISNFKMHPVRHLSVSNNNILCYSYNGNIYTQIEEQEPIKINVDVDGDSSILQDELLFVKGGVSDMVPSPNGKEIIFIYRGDVFATTVEGSLTRRLTKTPEQERSIDISPDGRTIVYAGERNNSWNLYTQTLSNKDETYFTNAIEIKEDILLENSKETFQPRFSPTGEAIAFLEDRTKLKTINLKTKNITSIHNGENHFSYADGDQDFEWSPDGKWFAITFYPDNYWFGEVGIVSANGDQKIINISKSGFSDSNAHWSKDGKILYWSSNRNGMHSVAKTGPTEQDIYGVFLTQQDYDMFKLKKDEFELLPNHKNEDKNETEKKVEDKKKTEEKPKIEPLKIDFENLSKRKEKLSLFSTRLSGAQLTNDSKNLLFMGRVDNKTNLWTLDLRTKDIKSMASYKGGAGFILDKDGKNAFVVNNGKISKVDLKSGKSKGVSINTEMPFNLSEEREYLIEHISRQVKKKFLDLNLHGAPWDELSTNYKKFVPYLNNDHDFKDILGELLGELNASHTGARYYSKNLKGDVTASLGVFYDDTYKGKGLKILEVMQGSPLIQGEKKVVTGVIIEAIDDVEITQDMNMYTTLNRRAGKPTIISFYNPITKTRWKERVKPISLGQENELRYQRWIELNRTLVHDLSNGEIGYMHVRSMSDGSYREFLEDVMGEEVNKKALIVDTRFNGGGDLVDDLTTFLSGKKYMEFKQGDRIIGTESQRRWTKPSVMLIGEGNYSDSHCTPVAYKDLEIGKLVGMPVPGTCSFVWWERIQNGIVFGIPNLQVTDMKGDVLENKQLEPDIKVKNTFENITNGKDQQIEAAVKELLSQIN